MNGLHKGTAPALIFFVILILVPAGCVKNQRLVSQTGEASEIQVPPEKETLSDYIRSLNGVSRVVDQHDVTFHDSDSPLSIEAARLLWQARKVANAVDVLLKLIDQDGENVEAHILLADILDRSGSYHQALVYASRALELASDSYPGLEVLARAQLHVGMSAAAVASYEKLMALGKDEMQALPKIALAHMQAKNWKQARSVLEKVTASPHAPRETLNNLAIVLGNLGLLDESLKYFKKANRPAAAFNNLGVLLAEQQKWEEAHQAFSRALELEPSYAKALVNRQEVESYLPVPMVVSLNEIPAQRLPVVTLDLLPGAPIQEIDLAKDAFESAGVLNLKPKSRLETVTPDSNGTLAIVNLSPVSDRPAWSSVPLEAIQFSREIFGENAVRVPTPGLPDLSTLRLPLLVDVPEVQPQEQSTETLQGLSADQTAPAPESSHLLSPSLRSLESILPLDLPARLEGPVFPVQSASVSEEMGLLGRTWEAVSVAISDFFSRIFG